MSKYQPKLDLEKLVAIDIHTHATISGRAPRDPCAHAFDEQMVKYFRSGKAPTIAEVAQYYRERNLAAVIFTVDAEAGAGHWRIANEEVAEVAAEARRLIEDYGVRGFKFHPSMQAFFPNDPKCYPLYEEIAGAGLPALFHTGQTGVGAGLPGGMGVKLKYSNPIYLDDVAADIPSLTIVMAHPSFPWQDEALAIATHKPNTWIDLSGWSPKYFPANLVQYANSLIKDRVLFGSDYPAITPDRWMADFEKLAMKPEVRPMILKENAIRLLKLRS
jgi:predicted TIM-barrel fold metal-dependent hydrolase